MIATPEENDSIFDDDDSIFLMTMIAYFDDDDSTLMTMIALL